MAWGNKFYEFNPAFEHPVALLYLKLLMYYTVCQQVKTTPRAARGTTHKQGAKLQIADVTQQRAYG
jgi:hypothetical protein